MINCNFFLGSVDDEMEEESGGGVSPRLAELGMGTGTVTPVAQGGQEEAEAAGGFGTRTVTLVAQGDSRRRKQQGDWGPGR